MIVRFASHLALSLFLASTVVGCADSGSDGSGGGGGAGGGAGGDGPDTPATCPAPTSGPTIHEGEVVGSETWSADAGPHIVRGDVNVRDGAKLTIEPCAVVRFEEDANLNVAYPLTPNSGELIAEGEEGRPIRFEPEGGARWGHVSIHAPGSARLAWLTIEGGGGPDTGRGESLEIVGDGELPGDRMVRVDHVTVKGAAGTAVSVWGGAAFTADSTDLTITESGTEASHFPIAIGELAIDTLPTGSYTGNAVDEILLQPEVVSAAGGLQEDATMHDRGVPYRVGENANGLDDLSIHTGDGKPMPTLTIEPGVVLRFLAGNALVISENDVGVAALVAVGTAEKPIVFTSAAESPAAGDWRGLWYAGTPSGDNKLEHVRLEYTGADCSCSMVTCNADVEEYEAAIILNDAPPAPFLKDSSIVHGAMHGVVQGYDGPSLDWTTSNTIEVSGCAQTLPRNEDTSCPDPTPTCMP